MAKKSSQQQQQQQDQQRRRERTTTTSTTSNESDNNNNNHNNHHHSSSLLLLFDKKQRSITTTPDGMEQCTFFVPRSANRIHCNLKYSDEWMPLFFSMGFDGKRIRNSASPGQVGVAYKAEYYQVTTSFAREKYERFEIVSFQYDSNQKCGCIEIHHQPNLFKNRNKITTITIIWSQQQQQQQTTTTTTTHHHHHPCTKVAVIRRKLPMSTLHFSWFKTTTTRQDRDDAYEELQLYLSH